MDLDQDSDFLSKLSGDLLRWQDPQFIALVINAFVFSVSIDIYHLSALLGDSKHTHRYKTLKDFIKRGGTSALVEASSSLFFSYTVYSLNYFVPCSYYRDRDTRLGVA